MEAMEHGNVKAAVVLAAAGLRGADLCAGASLVGLALGALAPALMDPRSDISGCERQVVAALAAHGADAAALAAVQALAAAWRAGGDGIDELQAHALAGRIADALGVRREALAAAVWVAAGLADVEPLARPAPGVH